MTAGFGPGKGLGAPSTTPHEDPGIGGLSAVSDVPSPVRFCRRSTIGTTLGPGSGTVDSATGRGIAEKFSLDVSSIGAMCSSSSRFGGTSIDFACSPRLSPSVCAIALIYATSCLVNEARGFGLAMRLSASGDNGCWLRSTEMKPLCCSLGSTLLASAPALATSAVSAERLASLAEFVGSVRGAASV